MVRVVAIDDHFLILEGVKGILDKVPSVDLIASGHCGEQVLDLVEAHSPDIMLLDIEMPMTLTGDNSDDFRILEVLPILNFRYPATQIIIISQYVSHALIETSFDYGVMGYILKNDALTLELAEAIKQVHFHNRAYMSKKIRDRIFLPQGDYLDEKMTHRQLEIVHTVLQHPNLSSDEIGKLLGITGGTVRNHLSAISHSLGVNNLTACIVELLKRGIISIS